MLKRFLIAATFAAHAILFAIPASAQCTGQFASGGVCANASASAGIPRQTTGTAWFDQVFGNTDGMMLQRSGGTWQATLTPVLSGPTITVADDAFTLQDGGDATKQLLFQLSGITAGQTRVLTVPDASTTLVGTDTTQTLTNKTLTSPDINGGTADALTSLGIRSTGAAFDLVMATAEVFTGSRTLSWTLNDANRSISLNGDVSLSGAFTTSGGDDVTLTTSGATNVTLPTTGTLATLAGSETFTNKTLTSPVISTIVNSGTLTLPTSTDTLVGRDTTDTLTNKTLTSPAINTATISGGTINNAVIGGTTPVAGTFTALTATQTAFLTGVISPSQITGNTNDYAPTGFSTATVLRLSTDASRNLTGLAGGADGRVIVIQNVGSSDLVLVNESASSTAANRFAIGADTTVAGGTSCTLRYDGTSSRWRSIGACGSGGGSGGGSGTVTNVATGAGLQGGPITTSGTIELHHDMRVQIAMLAMNQADILNVAQFSGAKRNIFADSFDTTTYVDTAGATNLDTGSAGLLKPTATSETQIADGTGTAIGDMTSNGGLTAAFNGTTNQAAATSAAKAGNPSQAYIGKNYSSSGAQRISKATIWPSNDAGFVGSADPSMTLTLRGKNGSAPTPFTGDGTLLGTTGPFTDVNSSTPRDITSSDTSTAWDYVWIEISGSGGTTIYAAEVRFFTPPVTNNVTVASSALTAVAEPSFAQITAYVKENVALTLGADLIFEVSRDGGTTWTEVPMTKLYAIGDVSVLESAVTDISGQPSGTDMKWRVTSDNNKSFELQAIHFYWRE